MASLDLTFINAGDDAEMDVSIDDGMRAENVIQELIKARFIPALNDTSRSYMLTIKGRNTIAEGQTLAAAGARANDQIRVSVTQRGGAREQNING